MIQEYNSAGTSINSTKVPAIFRKVAWVTGTKNLDWGGGKYDTATDYLKALGVENFVYDPYNRTPEHNAQIGTAGSYNTATISNVLNVIKEPEIRREIILKVLDFLKKRGIIYIEIYEGDGSGVGRQTKKGCWQNNAKTEVYASELKEFKPAKRGHTIIIIKEDK